MEVKIRMPDLSTTGDDVTVLEWLIEVGQPVKRGGGLLTVETDKAIVEVESVASGVLKTQSAQPGDAVPTGAVVAVLEAEDAAVAASRFREHGMNPPATEISVARLAAYERGFLLDLYERMVRIREFEEGVKFLFLEGSMPGTIHQCQGQEATAVGVCAALQEDDWITSTFRGHGHALAKGLTVEEMLFELFGATTGCCAGKGGSMHMGNMAKGMIPACAIVGGSIPMAAGLALAFKMQRTGQIAACFFGDGATSEGAFHEGITLAAIWNLPAMFVCENNFYGASTRVDRVTRLQHLADHAAGYGIRGQTVDGNDVLAVYEAAKQAAEECRSGQGPVLLELLTYRRTGHSRRDVCHYQPKEERAAWFDRDPIDVLRRGLVQRPDVDARQLDGLRATIVQQFSQAVAAAKVQPQPTSDDLICDVFA